MVRRRLPLIGLEADMPSFMPDPSADLDSPVIGWDDVLEMYVWVEGPGGGREMMVHPSISNPPEALHLNGDFLYFKVRKD